VEEVDETKSRLESNGIHLYLHILSRCTQSGSTDTKEAIWLLVCWGFWLLAGALFEQIVRSNENILGYALWSWKPEVGSGYELEIVVKTITQPSAKFN
jgi:hypothetical protein